MRATKICSYRQKIIYCPIFLIISFNARKFNLAIYGVTVIIYDLIESSDCSEIVLI